MSLWPDASETIAAVSTAVGRAALSLVRVSGPDVPSIARHLLDPYPAEPRRATLATARENGVVLDQLIAVRYEAPSSYTGEAMLELICHGGEATTNAVLRGCLSLGARPARQGEFTQRALLNGKMDLAQAEAIPDLIDAASEPMRRVALGIVGGGLSRHIAELREKLLDLEAVMAYSIDFPEEDEGEVPRDRVLALSEDISGRLSRLHGSAGRGLLIRRGALVVLAGPPNAGKSSLFNALLGQDRAIVTHIPGTTRDAVEHPAMVRNWPVRLVDTAGLRTSTDLVERLGIEISERYVKDADVTLVCSDGQSGRLGELLDTVRTLGPSTLIGVETKLDIRDAADLNGEAARVSVVTGEGLEGLRARIAEALEQRHGVMDYESPVITQARHASLVARAGDEVNLFRQAIEAEVTPSIAAVHLRAGVMALEEIIGAVSVDDLLDQVFSRFCIGK